MSAHPDDCVHEWVPLGFFGPYPTEQCTRCNTGALLPVPGHPAPFGVLLDALDAAGCDPHPIVEVDE